MMEEFINMLSGETVTIESPKEEVIPGYRNLSPQEKSEINRVRGLEKSLLSEINYICEDNVVQVDPRWIAIARTNIEQGFMALVRAIAKPDTVRMPRDIG